MRAVLPHSLSLFGPQVDFAGRGAVGDGGLWRHDSDRAALRWLQ